MYRYFYYCLLLLFVGSVSAQNTYFPPSYLTGQWETTSPESLGWQTDSIPALYDFLNVEKTDAFLVLKDGRIVLEQYFGTYTQDSLHYWASASKSLRAVLMGIAQEEGHLNIGDPVSDYLGVGWTSLNQEQEDSIKILNQLTMTCGLNEFLSANCTDPECLIYRAPVDTRWSYHNSPYSLTEEVLEAATGQTLNGYTNSRFEASVGGSNGFWFPYDAFNSTYFSRARLMARFGLFVQSGGNWAGQQLVQDTAYFSAMLAPSQSLNPSYGYLWWLNGQESYIGPDLPFSLPGPISPDAPADVLLAAGADGQFISISREKGMIMIRQGQSENESLAPIDLHNEIWRRLGEICAGPVNSVVEKAPATSLVITPYPNPVDNEIRFTPPTSIGSYWVSLYDQRGKLILRRANSSRLDVGDLPGGLYRLVVNASNQRGSNWVRIK